MIITKDEYDKQLENEGRQIATVEFVKNALEHNMSDNDIMDICEISQEQLEHIKEEYKKAIYNNQDKDKELEK